MTALTLAGTLSRVMTSWGGTSMVTVLRSILTMLSTSGHKRKSPGPFGPPWTRPRRKITPRSYSLTTLMALNKIEATSMITTTKAMNAKPTLTACKSANPIRQCSSPVATLPTPILPPPRRHQTRERETRTGPPSLTTRRPVGTLLEEPSRSHVATYVVYAGDGHLTGVVGGVDGRTVAHGYADVGDGPATVLAPEEQVSRLGSTADRGTVAHLPPRSIGQGDAELLEDQHREAGAVLGLESCAGSRWREHVGGSQVLLRHGEHVVARTTHPTPATTGARSGRGGRSIRCRVGRGQRFSAALATAAPPGVLRASRCARRSTGRCAGLGGAFFGTPLGGFLRGGFLRGGFLRGGACGSTGLSLAFGTPLGGLLRGGFLRGGFLRGGACGSTGLSLAFGTPLGGLLRGGFLRGGFLRGGACGSTGLGGAFFGTPVGGLLRGSFLRGGACGSTGLSLAFGTPLGGLLRGSFFGSGSTGLSLSLSATL